MRHTAPSTVWRAISVTGQNPRAERTKNGWWPDYDRSRERVRTGPMTQKSLELDMPFAWPPAREAARNRLAAFLPNSGSHYARTRNHDLGPNDRSNVSLLSPYVRHRVVSEAEIVSAVLERFAPSTAEKFIQEVVWRTYWKGWLEHRPSVWMRYLTDVTRLRDGLGGAAVRRLTDAEAGNTGIACFDAWARELTETGYMHNHARMWFASIWIYTLGLPWQLGADFFQRHLLDGDPASNTLSWRWVCGLQTQGKTYLARPDNIDTYTSGRFEPTPRLAASAPPLEDAESAPRVPLAAIPSVPPEGDVTLLVTEDDLTPDQWLSRGTTVRRVVVADTADAYPGTSERVVTFKRALLHDASQRLAALYGVPAPIVGVPALPVALPSGTRLVVADLPVGPARGTLLAILADTERRGDRVYRVRRAWDQQFWPYATAGFFKVKDKIPAGLRALGLGAG